MRNPLNGPEPNTDGPIDPGGRPGKPWFVIGVFALLAVGAVAAGSWYFLALRDRLSADERAKLQAVAGLKAEQVATWLHEQVTDGRAIVGNPFVGSTLKRLFAGTASQEELDRISHWLETRRQEHRYQGLHLVDPDGVVRLSAGGVGTPLGARALARAVSVARTGEVQVSDLVPNEVTGAIQLSVDVPIAHPDGAGAPPLGTLAIHLDPHEELYPLIQPWPLASRTAEAYLVRVDGEEVVYLSELRHFSAPPLTLRLPLDTPDLAAARAAAGDERVAAGVDYRGVEVLAVARQVRNTSWTLIAEVDAEEVYAPLRHEARLIGLVLAALLGAGGTAVAFYVQRQRWAHHRARLEIEARRAALISRHEHLLHQAHDVILLVDGGGTILEANERAREVYGYDPEELIGSDLRRLLPPEARGPLAERLDEVRRSGGMRYEARHVRKDGTVFPVELASSHLEVRGRAVFQSIVRDITARVRAEEELRTRLRELRLLADNLPAGIARLDRDLRYRFTNRQYAAMVGANGEDLDGRTVFEVTKEEAYARARPWIERALAGEKVEFERSVTLPDGRTRWLHAAYVPDVAADGAVVGFYALVTDLTERRQAEVELLAAKERFQALIEAAPVAITMLDPGGRVLLWNAAAERTFGWSEEEAVGSPLPIVPPRSQAEFDGLRQRVLSGEAITGVERERIRKDGSSVLVSISAAPIHDASGTAVGIMAVILDVTERHRLEEQIRQMQKMEAVGRLAGGIAHDFNNLLTAITGYAEIAAQRLEEGPRLRAVEQIRAAADRAAELTRQLLAFSRKQILRPRRIDLNDVLEGMDGMLRRILGEDIEIRTLLEPDLPPVVADPGQLEQVVMNLSVNARDAMPAGGRLMLETARVELDASYADRHAEARTGPYVMLAVTDSGSGMPPEVVEHLFEPFFTTKPVGKGTGLGLSTVYGIVKQSGGNIWVYSEPDRGTTFKVYLPAAAGAAEPLPARPDVPGARGGAETILLAEDDPSVRGILCEALQVRGYRVLEAASAEEALELARTHDGPIHLLVTDVVMPRIGGRELARTLEPMRPGIQVLYISGYTSNAIVHQGMLDPGIHFLQKPFTPDALGKKVREMLDGPEDEA
jgi:two-component system, cell cycle sensor histidine kinase and response regulator CckA